MSIVTLIVVAFCTAIVIYIDQHTAVAVRGQDARANFESEGSRTGHSACSNNTHSCCVAFILAKPTMVTGIFHTGHCENQAHKTCLHQSLCQDL